MSMRAPLQRRVLGMAAVSLLALTACDHEPRLHDVEAVGLSNPELRHPIRFDARIETLDVEVPPDAEGLSPNQHTDVYRFLKAYRREANRSLVISVPGTSRPPASIAHSLKGIQRHLVEANVDYRLARGKHVPAGEIPVIRLAYRSPVAVPPVCDRWSENVGRNEERIPYPNFGCATQRNLAIMADNARDLKQPQDVDPRSGERRHTTWSAYAGKAGDGGGGGGDEGGGTAPKAPGLKK
jgi:pilus assembly protein CpaD